MKNHNKQKKTSVWSGLSIASLLCGCFTLYKGIDKMVNYRNSEIFTSKNVNAYVGGDAYNYIINGTYATAFFVLTAMFVLAAIGLLIVHYISREKVNVSSEIEQKTMIEDIESNLPRI